MNLRENMKQIPICLSKRTVKRLEEMAKSEHSTRNAVLRRIVMQSMKKIKEHEQNGKPIYN